MKIARTLYLLGLMLINTQISYAKNEVKYYEPIKEEIHGTVSILTFPGQPNYTSIRNGDANETGPYLILDHPFDVEKKKIVNISFNCNGPYFMPLY